MYDSDYGANMLGGSRKRRARDEQPALHESFDREDSGKASSDRSFGLLFAAVFAIIGLFPALRGGEPHIVPLVVAMGFLLFALARPSALHPLSAAWTKLSLLMHAVMTPLIMGVIFFVVVTPVALFFKLVRRDTMRRKFDHSQPTYWIIRDSPGTAAQSMRNQF